MSIIKNIQGHFDKSFPGTTGQVLFWRDDGAIWVICTKRYRACRGFVRDVCTEIFFTSISILMKKKSIRKNRSSEDEDVDIARGDCLVETESKNGKMLQNRKKGVLSASTIKERAEALGSGNNGPSSVDTNRFDKYKRALSSPSSEDIQVATSETPSDRDAKAVLEKKIKLNKTLTGQEDVYLGINYYKSFIPKEDTVSGNAASQKYKAGPMRLPSNVKSSCRFDFQPHVCKDYKESGSCGFGDSCIYVHDRGDYKSGWQLDEQWSSKQEPGDDDDDPFLAEEKDRQEGPPTDCPICKSQISSPVITK